MKFLNEFGDLLSMAVGMVGALLKGLKSRLHFTSVILGMMIAGILTFSIIGVIEQFYSTLSPKFIILISFCVGWVANEITSKLDSMVNDLYNIFISWIKAKFNSKSK